MIEYDGERARITTGVGIAARVAVDVAVEPSVTGVGVSIGVGVRPGVGVLVGVGVWVGVGTSATRVGYFSF